MIVMLFYVSILYDAICYVIGNRYKKKESKRMNFFTRIGWCWHALWRWIKALHQMLHGAWKISKLNAPIVTIFGGARFLQADRYAVQANKLAAMFIEHDISVITGGGSGIMEAANCGAVAQASKKGQGKSIGINVKGLEARNKCAQEYFELNDFFARKYLMTHFSVGFVVFPGGFGTLEELGEILTLIRTHKMPRLPIILIGVEYWTPFMQWLNNEVLAHGAITNEDIELFVLTDDLERALSLVCSTCQIASGGSK